MINPHIGRVRGPLTPEQFMDERDRSRAEQRARLGDRAAVDRMGNIVDRATLDDKGRTRPKGPSEGPPLADHRDRSAGR